MRTTLRSDDIHSHDRDEKAYDVHPPSDYRSGDEPDSGRSSEDVQAGVRRIEAVSKSWTLASLIVAYVTYVLIFAADLCYLANLRLD